MYQFASTVLTKCHMKLVTCTQKCMASQFWRIDIQVQGVGSQFPLKAVGENLFYVSPLGSGDFIAIFGAPWIVAASSQSVSLSSHGFTLCVYLKFPLFIKILVIVE